MSSSVSSQHTVCTVKQTLRSHTQASLIAFVLSTPGTQCPVHKCCRSREWWQWIAKCQHTGEVCATFVSLFVYLYLALCLSNSQTPNMSLTAPPSSRNEAYCWPTCWHTAVHFFSNRSRLRDEPRSWQKRTAGPDTLHLCTFFHSCANKCKRNSQEI